MLAVSGGFRTTVGGFRISARSPLPIVFLAFTNAAMWFMAARRAGAIAADLESAWRFFERHSRIVVAIALTSALVAAMFSTRSAAGADASGYLSESAMLAGGRLSYVDPLSDLARGHDPYLTSPLGWRPAPGGRQSPTYPPGLPLLMAIPHAIAGVNGASAVVVVSAAIAVIATALIAFELAGGIAAVIAAVLLAFSPVFIYQSIQPMSDVPVTAAWMVSFLLLVRRGGPSGPPAGAAWAGVACAIAVLIRPNLAPLAIVPLLLARNRIAFSIPVAAAGVGLAVLQFVWYGSPFRSGYGSTEELFSLANILPNLTGYVTRLIGTAPVLLMSVFGFFRLRHERRSQVLFAFAGLVIAAYLVYAVFAEWTYLRFLLPAMAVLAVFAAVELAAWINRWPLAVRAPILFALLLGVTAHSLTIARGLDTFRLADQLRRVSQVADFINEDVPPSAVILAGEQSGSMRYYTERSILRWEAATAAALTAATTTLEESRRPVYLVLDAWENEPFRAKFADVAAVSLDWPPMLDAGTSHRTRIWKLSDRDRFLKGERLNTIRLP
jgi:hypothetical protein